MATIAQGGTIQIQSSSYGSLGHQTQSQTVHQGQSPSATLITHSLIPRHRFLHFDLNRIIDNNFDLFYLINTLKAPPSSISR